MSLFDCGNVSTSSATNNFLTNRTNVLQSSLECILFHPLSLFSTRFHWFCHVENFTHITLGRSSHDLTNCFPLSLKFEILRHACDTCHNQISYLSPPAQRDVCQIMSKTFLPGRVRTPTATMRASLHILAMWAARNEPLGSDMMCS